MGKSSKIQKSDQVTAWKTGEGTYYCAHVFLQFGGPQFEGWAGLNLQCLLSQ